MSSRTGRWSRRSPCRRDSSATSQTMATSPSLVLRTGSGGLAPRVTQQMQSLVYQLNQKLQAGYIAANLEFVRLILHGGSGKFLGRHFTLLGLDGTAAGAGEAAAEQAGGRDRALRPGRARRPRADRHSHSRRRRIRSRSRSRRARGRTWVLSAQVQAYGIAVTVTFLALLLAAGAAAAEKDEGTIGRLRRGLVSFGQLVWAKSAARRRSSDSDSARRSLSSSASSSRSAASPAASRGRDCRCSSWASRSSAASSARSASCSARSRGRRGRRRCSPCSSCCRSSSSASSRAARSRPRTGSACSCRSPTRCAGSAPRCTTRIRGGRSRSRRSGSIGIGLAFGLLARLGMRRLAA